MHDLSYPLEFRLSYNKNIQNVNDPGSNSFLFDDVYFNEFLYKEIPQMNTHNI